MKLKTRVTAVLMAGFAFSASACMTFVAGKKVSSTGRVIVGHNEDDFPPLVVRHGMLPAKDWPTGTCLPATPGCCANVPQASHTLACYWGEVKFPYGDGNIESSVCEFMASPRDTVLHLATGHGCEKPYLGKSTTPPPQKAVFRNMSSPAPSHGPFRPLRERPRLSRPSRNNHILRNVIVVFDHLPPLPTIRQCPLSSPIIGILLP